MLTIDNSQGFCSYNSYPTYEYQEVNGTKRQGRCDGGKLNPIPEGYKEVIHYATEQEHFNEYLKDLEDGHKNHTDKEMLNNPTGIFIGRGRNSRWIDEIKRRNLS